MMNPENNRPDYSGIKTLEELRSCRADVDRRIDVMSEKLAGQYDYVKMFYSPSNLAGKLMGAVTPFLNLINFLMDFWDRLKAEWSKRREGRQKLQEGNQEHSTE